jgi:hypothetical protein
MRFTSTVVAVAAAPHVRVYVYCADIGGVTIEPVSEQEFAV